MKKIICVALALCLLTGCSLMPDGMSSKEEVSSQSVSSKKEEISSQSVSSKKEEVSSQSVSSKKEEVSSQSVSSKKEEVSSQNVSSKVSVSSTAPNDNKPHTGIYEGVKWRSPTAKPYSEKYGREMLLVNNYYELTNEFKLNLVLWAGNQYVDADVYPHLKQMFADAKAAGVPLQLVSPYRSVNLQDRLFEEYVVKWQKAGYSLEKAIDKANELRVYPGTSEHNTGYACDILEQGNFYLSEAFENTAAFKWLSANAQNYGFILRYPKDKTSITEILYEPWHYRYVGVENAKKIKASGLCLEEYIDYLGGY